MAATAAPRRGRLTAPIFLLSMVALAYQVALMRILAIAQWHHFAYMIISVAMLGFGASGTILALAPQAAARRAHALLPACAWAAAASLTVCYALAQLIPFETFELLARPVHFGYLAMLYGVLALPFFLIAACLAMAFMMQPEAIARLYGANMVGSGLGALGVMGLLFFVEPSRVPFVLTVPAAGAACLLMRGRGAPRAMLALLTLALVAAALWHVPIRLSQYKGLAYARLWPDAEVVAQTHSPASLITAVTSTLIRETPGQISAYPMSELGPIPSQVGLYYDGGGVSVVNRFDGSFEAFAYLDYVTAALIYRLVETPRVCVIGPGGGTDVLAALAHGASHVTAVEADPRTFQLVRDELGPFSGYLYDRPDVTAVVAEGRAFLRSSETQYDVIHIGLLDSFTAAAAGALALNESYLYTVEALASYLDSLTPQGVLAITRWLKSPPRDALKMFATAAAALEQAGVEEPKGHLVLIRSWNNALLLVTREPLSGPRIEAVRQFCRERQFDVCYYPGMAEEEANRYTILERPVYHRFAMAVLFGDRAAALRDYPFYVTPATDDRPYFFRFFKWRGAAILAPMLVRNTAPIIEWGYLILWACLAQSVAGGACLIALPLVFGRRRDGLGGRRRWILAAFWTIGLAYMFLEIAMIQRFMLFLAYPLYAISVVLAALLVFSGLGSFFAGRFQARRAPLIAWAVAGITFAAVAYLRGLPWVFAACGAWDDASRIGLSIVLIAPMAFCMGIPFPILLRTVADRSPSLLPWAWGVNGCASVAGASTATIIAIHAGFGVLVGLALGLYVAAGLAASRLMLPGATD